MDTVLGFVPALFKRFNMAMGTALAILVFVGQSNANSSGTGIDAMLDAPDPNVFEWRNQNNIVAQEPLLLGGATEIGFGLRMAKRYSKHYESPVLIVQAAVGNTGFTGNFWGANEYGWIRAVDFVNAAVAANPGAQVKAISWIQGETDAIAQTSEATYQSALVSSLSAMRNSMATASNAPILIGEMVPSWYENNVDARAIRIATNKAIGIIPNAYSVSSRVPTVLVAQSDTIHYSAASMRILGDRFFERLRIVLENQANPARKQCIGAFG